MDLTDQISEPVPSPSHGVAHQAVNPIQTAISMLKAGEKTEPE
jgi:hypothetical protein